MPKQREFDVIVVGAGSAGCLLANKLTRDPSLRVLLIEAGGWDWNPLISIPIGARKLAQYGLYEWGDVSEPDSGLDGRRMAIPHGKVIGGSSSINYMAHTRGHPADYDGWASAGAAGWSYADVLSYFKECETWERGGDAWRGGSGELGAEEARMTDPIYEAWFEAVRNLGYSITADYNSGEPEGFGPAQYTVRNGRRASSARVFLRPALKRPNLTVATRTTATRLAFEGRRVAGVEYVAGGRCGTVRATRRTVLCLGAINTPHLMMLSGIGPADHLRSVGVRVIADLPVGRNLEDHLGVSMHWARKSPGHFHAGLRLDRLLPNLARAYLLGKGSATRIPGVVLGFIRSKSNLSQPDLELIMQMIPADANFWFPGLKKPYTDGFGIRVQLLSQKSRGEVLLRSADPAERPRVFYNSLSAPDDLIVLREGFKRAQDIGNSSELEPFRAAAMSPGHELRTDAEIDAFIRANAIQLYHPGCTCRMGHGDDAVVAPDLTVRGVEGLSIADSSVMPRLVSANINIPIMMIAAKAAAMIRSQS